MKNEIIITNLECSPAFDEKVWTYSKEILKNGGSMWYSPTRESTEICILDVDGERHQFAVLHEEGIGFGGAWELVKVLHHEHPIVVVKSNSNHYCRTVDFDTTHSVSFDEDMWKHVVLRLVRRARQTKADGGIAFMLLDGGNAVYIEDNNALVMQFIPQENTLKVRMEGTLPFVSSDGFFRLGDVMFYIPPNPNE